jgi:hypothetical protein
MSPRNGESNILVFFSSFPVIQTLEGNKLLYQWKKTNFNQIQRVLIITAKTVPFYQSMWAFYRVWAAVITFQKNTLVCK